MARKPNYDFEKRRKEMDRKAKKDAKRDEKQRRKDAGIADDTYPADALDAGQHGPAQPDRD